MDSLLLTLFAFFLVLLNGFFVAAEFAIVKVRMARAEELARTDGILGRIVLKVRSNLDSYLSGCQLGITLASLGLGWIGEPAFSELIEPPMLALGYGSPELVHGISFALAFALISFLHIVIGEQAPKSLAIRKAEEVSLWTAVPLFLFYWMMFPFIWLLNGSSTWVLRSMNVELAHENDSPYSADEIRQVLAASHRHGELDAHETKLLSQTLDLSDLAVGDLMRPAIELVTIDIRDGFQENLAEIARHRYSRYPVSDGGRDHLLGLLHVKDLFAAMQERPDTNDLRPLLRELPMTHRDTPAMKMFRRFKRGYPHLAAVTDDIGSIIGFITFDHILRAAFGEVQDEFRRAREGWAGKGDGVFEGKGSLSIYSLELLLGRALAEESVDSVSGLLMQRLDRVPEPGEMVEFDGFSIEVLEMSGPRLERVRVTLHEPPSAEIDATDG